MQIPERMRAMVMLKQGGPLQIVEVDVPAPSSSQLLIKIDACGVCRTDLHILDGELVNPKLPLILGHEIVGTVAATGDKVRKFKIGERVGVPWLGGTCGNCRYCYHNQENLCDNATFTGYTVDGGYCQYTVAHQAYTFHIPHQYDSHQAAPLLCAGLISYRSYRMLGKKINHLGIYGFGAAGHIIAQIAIHHGKKVYAFTRPGDSDGQSFARSLGAFWAGDSTEMPPEKLDGAIIFAPVGSLIPQALKATAKGGTVVCGGIHMSDIPPFPYSILWEERVVRSVANLTRKDGEELLRIAPEVLVKTEVEVFTLEEANQALDNLRRGELRGVAVLGISG